MLRNYKELLVWKKAYQLCLDVYKITKVFPNEEKFGLVSQIRRSAVSVPSNIAEGYSRGSRAEYIRALYIAYGSHCELETQIILSGDLGYVESESLERIQKDIGDIERMLTGLIKSLKNTP